MKIRYISLDKNFENFQHPIFLVFRKPYVSILLNTKIEELVEKYNFRIFFQKVGFFNFYNFLRAPFSSKNVIFRFIKIFENFQNGQGTQIFWFLETSMEVDYKIPKSTN